ncbi:Peptidoglycan-recognition protein SB1 [Folsomia candida]|uniref:Peptidoglycan-recognition protein SB1 n=1 Tax=Folsomia candida TaxID=158441 RepID=A0A226D125_FOLCA|nr:Peptidoglycan-recognition protein SB1 [Folsomia candida]
MLRFLIGGDGNLYEGRGWGRQVQGTQPPEWNYLGYTFCLIGTFEDELPTAEQLERLNNLINCAWGDGHVPENYTLRGHRDVYAGTACPGQAFYDQIQTWPHYNASLATSN